MRTYRLPHLAISCLTAALVLPASGSVFNWDGQIDDQWDTISAPFSNWSPDGVPGSGDIVSFGFFASSTTSVELGADRTVLSANFGSVGNHTITAGGGGGGTPFALTLATGDITVAGSPSTHQVSAGITLGDTGDWVIGDNAVFTVSGIVSGPYALNKSGLGTLKLTGADSYTGITRVQEGTLIATGSDERLPDGTSVQIDPDAALRIDGITETIDGLRNSAGALFLDNGATLQVTPTAVRTFPGTITGAANTTFSVIGGVKPQRLNAANPDFFGTARITGGELRLLHADALQNATVDIQVDDGLDVTTDSINANIGALKGTGDLDLGSQQLMSGLNNTSTSYSGIFNGTSSSRMRHNGTGTLTLTGGTAGTPSTLGTMRSEHTDGTIVVDGARLDLSSTESSISTGALIANAGDITLQGGADVQSAVDGYVVAHKDGTLTVKGAGTSLSGKFAFVGPSAASTGALVVEDGGATTITDSLVVGFEGNGDLTVLTGGAAAANELFIAVTASGDALVTGAGSLLSSANNMNLGGEDEVKNGGTGVLTVQDDGAVAITRNTKFWSSTSTITINGGTLETGKIEEHTGVTGTFSLSDPAGGTALTVGGNDTDSTFSGQIQDAAGGAGSLRKVGTGVLEISGTNSYSGGTIVDGGTLRVATPVGSATGSGTVQVNSGATLGGNGEVSGATTIASAATLAPGDSIGSLGLGGNLTIQGTYQCELGGTASDQVTVGGTLTLGSGSVLDFDETAAPTEPAYVIASYQTRSGEFTSVTDLPVGYKLVYDYDDGGSSNNIALVVLTAYESWAVDNGLTLGVNDGFDDDPNHDGRPNIEHFAFNTDPLGSGGDEGKLRGTVINDGGTDYFSLTLPVRSGAVFAGTPSPGATIDGIVYTAQGSADLSTWDEDVVEVSPAASSGLPTLDSDWSYRTFRLSTPLSSQPRGFLRVTVGP